MTKEQKKEYIDDCISSGKAVKPEGFKLSAEVMNAVEDAVYRFNDTKARKILNKILK